MNINFLDYINVVIVLACLLVGFIIKKWFADVDNKYIPTIVFALGVGLQFITVDISLLSFVIGGISGLASTGLYEMFRNFLEQKEV